MCDTVRGLWADRCNAALAKAGHHTTIDHRTLKAQGISRVPTAHLGVAVAALEARGIRTDKVARLTAVAQRDSEARDLDSKIKSLEKTLIHERLKNERAARATAPATSITDMQNLFGVDNIHDLGRPEDVLQQNAPDRIRSPETQDNHAYMHKLDGARVIDPRSRYHPDNVAKRKEQEMATQEQRDLSRQATAYKKENPNYHPSLAVLRAVDAVLIEQAKERLKTAQAAPVAVHDEIAQAEPVKSIVELLKASYDACKAFVGKQAGRLRGIADGGFSGRVKHADAHHAVQHLGADHYSIHKQADLSQPLVSGQWADIKYKNGRGNVQIDLEQGKGKGGIGD